MLDAAPAPAFDRVHTTLSAPDPAPPLQQSALWAQAVTTLGGRCLPLEGVTGARGHALLRRVPVLGEVALVSRGPAGLTAEGAGRLRRALGVRHLIVNAEDAAGAMALRTAGFRRIDAPRRVAELALSPDTAAMGRRLSVKWRNRLRRGIEAGLTVSRRPMPADPDHWLLREEARAARSLGYAPLPRAMIAALAGAAPGAGQVFIAHLAGQRVAAMAFFRHGRAATYQIGWSRPEGRTAHAGPLLMWRAMVELQELGVALLDLGSAPETAPGLSRFKAGTGARLRDLGGTWIDSAAIPRKRARAA